MISTNFIKYYTIEKNVNFLFQLFRLFFYNNTINEEDIFFKKKDISKYYGVDISTWKNWVELFVNDKELKESLLCSNTSISFYEFEELAKVIGYANIEAFYVESFDDKTNYIIPSKQPIDSEKIIQNNHFHYIKYKAYTKNEIFKALKNFILDYEIDEVLNIDHRKIKILPPKQSYEILRVNKEYDFIEMSIAIFDTPTISTPNIRKSQKNTQKKYKDFLLKGKFIKNNYYFNKMLNKPKE